jgi:hypothetical protein
VTLLVFSVIGFGLIGFLEIHLLRQRRSRQVGLPVSRTGDPLQDGANTASIYSAPKTLEKWKGHRKRSSRPSHLKFGKAAKFWLGLLQIISFATPLVYTLLFAACLAGWMGWSSALCGMFGFMLVLSLVSVAGIVRGEAWGLVAGFAIAIIHLLVFPAGTAAGLILLAGLVGATPWFLLSPREQRRVGREKRQKKLCIT